MSTQAKTLLTPEQYLEIERKAEFKSEYYAGEMFAMSGGTDTHSLLAAEVVYQLRNSFQKRDCRVYTSDMRVMVSATKLYTYPDVSAVCGIPQFADDGRDMLTNPTVIVEVLSPSTEAYDRGRKFEHYRTIPSLQQYVLIASDRIHVDVYTREADERWLLAASSNPSDIVALTSVECTFRVADLYEKTSLIEEPGEQPLTT